MLRGLSEIGARFVAFLAHEIAPRPDGPKGPTMVFRFRGNPIAAFERVWRAVRLALSLCMRIQDEIGRLKAGKPLGPHSIFSRRHAPMPNA